MVNEMLRWVRCRIGINPDLKTGVTANLVVDAERLWGELMERNVVPGEVFFLRRFHHSAGGDAR
jgi:hypothetical protein